MLDKKNIKSLVLAKDIEFDVKRKKNINTLIIGNSNSGKYESFIFPNIGMLLGSYILVDTDNIIYDKTNELFREKDYNILKIDLKSNTDYNPFMYIKKDIDTLTFSNLLIKRNPILAKNKYDEDLCEIIFRIIVKYILKTQKIENHNLQFVIEIINDLKENDTDYFKAMILELNNKTYIKNYYNIIDNLDINSYKTLVDLLENKLCSLGKENIKYISAQESIDFYEIRNKKTVLYINISDNHVINSIFFTQLVKSLHDSADKNNGFLNIPTYCFLDNFEKLGYISMFDKRLSTSKSRKIMYGIIIDDIKPLVTLYGDDLVSIFQCCNLALYLGTNNTETLKFFSENFNSNIPINVLLELKSDMCIIYESGVSSKKAIKLKNKHYNPPVRQKLNMQLIQELEEKTASESNPDKKEKLEKALSAMKFLNGI